ncbi:glycoside hydrolase family 18 protein [Victivallis sp. Marseille-Q1083]|uniref:glycoside hydrolase family 18 protein n=1 Tax=Victivallis sp. Marseille-Q1083 TaxID=2717288 RepID=UPI00158CAC4B|nr:glycoside hydrolase family 18 protein [Victivallis sp. Marseille-Q1083]
MNHPVRRFFSGLLAVGLLGGCCQPCRGAEPPEPMLGGYFTYSMPVDEVRYDTYNFVFQAFLNANRDGVLQLDERYLPYPELVEQAHKNGAKVIVSLGGGGFGDFPVILETPEKLRKFADAIVDFVDRNDYDGVDLDWELPRTPEDGERWKELMITLRLKLDKTGNEKGRKMYLTSALPAGEWAYEFIDKAVLRTCLDYINVMCYDHNWGKAAYHAPLFADPEDPLHDSTVEGLEYLEKVVGVPRARLSVGVPFYGNTYRHTPRFAKAEDDNWFDDSYASMISRSDGWKKVYEPNSKGTWYFSPDGSQIMTLDSPQSIYEKTQWALSNGYGGVFCWAMVHDRMPDGSRPLTDAMKKAAETRNLE